ncbi:MAG: hypothetical protein ACR2NM_05830, partial [Bythopirellula sp.]
MIHGQLMHPQGRTRTDGSCLLGMMLACAFTSVPSHTAESAVTATLVTPASSQAVERGLSLLSDQQLDDGPFGTNGSERNVAVFSFGGTAFLASG